MEIVEFKPIQNWAEANKLLELVYEKFSVIPQTEIKDEGARCDVGNLMREVAHMTKQLEAVAKHLKQPAKDYVEQIDFRIKPCLESLRVAKKSYETSVLAWDNKKMELLRVAEIARVAKEKERLLGEQVLAEMDGKRAEVRHIERVSEAVEVKQIKNIIKEEAAGVTIRKIKKFRIIDENLIPREYLLVDETKIRKAMFANLAVEGVEYYDEQTTSVRI